MSKAIAEQSNSLSIFWLKKHDYLNKNYNRNIGGIKWTNEMSGNENSIGFVILRDNFGTTEEKTYIELRYSWGEEKEYMNYKVQLTTTPCNYGKNRYWFICPLTKNEKYCGRRVGVLYKIGKWFGCRHCGEIAYNSQMQSEKYKGFVSIPDIERAEEKVKRYYYKGKPTRKYRKVMKLNEKFEDGLLKSYSRLVGLKK